MKITTIRDHALSLPDVTEEPHFESSSFRVRGKIFVTFPPDEEHIHVFVSEEHRNSALDAYPSFVEELKWGKKIMGLRITMALATASVVKQLVSQAWHDKASKTLRAKLEREEGG